MKRILVIAVIMLAACGGPKIYSGEIIRLDYQAAYTTIIIQCMGRNSSGACTMYYPEEIYHSENWTVMLRACEDNKCKEDWYSIPERQWSELELGQEWTVPEGYR